MAFFEGKRDEGDGVRERIAYLFMITILVVLIAVTFGVLGKGEYQPPKEDDQPAKGDVHIVVA
jgi:hypothetical protein